jgi:hypothetical protein
MKYVETAIQIFIKSVEILTNRKKWHFKITSNYILNYKKQIFHLINKIKATDKNHQLVNSNKIIYFNNLNNLIYLLLINKI